MKPKIYYRIKEAIFHIGTKWDKLSPDETSAIEFAHKYLNHDPEPYIPGGTEFSLEYRLACSCDTISDRYRIDRPEEIDGQIAEKLYEYKCNTDLILYRGITTHIYNLMKKHGKTSGYDLYEKGFMATSLVKGHEYKEDIYLRIFLPKGTHALYQGNVNGQQELYEVDIQRGAKLKIISMDDTYINCKVIEVL